MTALQYGVLAADIKRTNKFYSPVLFPGTTLQLPAGARLQSPKSLPPAVQHATAAGAGIEAEPAATPQGKIDDHGGYTVQVYDTSASWDGEAGFIGIAADDRGSACSSSSQDLPCTWAGSLFTPDEDSLLTGVELNLRLVEGDNLAFRVVLAEWGKSSSRSAVAAPEWATPAAKIPGQGAEGLADRAPPAEHGVGNVLFCSEVMRITRQDSCGSEWSKIKCSFRNPPEIPASGPNHGFSPEICVRASNQKQGTREDNIVKAQLFHIFTL